MKILKNWLNPTSEASKGTEGESRALAPLINFQEKGV
jgi:hypothetical protein